MDPETKNILELTTEEQDKIKEFLLHKDITHVTIGGVVKTLYIDGSGFVKVK